MAAPLDALFPYSATTQDVTVRDYAEFDALTNRMAHALRALGVKTGATVQLVRDMDNDGQFTSPNVVLATATTGRWPKAWAHCASCCWTGRGRWRWHCNGRFSDRLRGRHSGHGRGRLLLEETEHRVLGFGGLGALQRGRIRWL